MSLVVPFDDIFADKAGLLANHSSWQRVELGSVCKILNGFAFKSSLFNREQGFPIIRIRDLSKGIAETLYKGDFPSEYVVDNGDLLIGMDGNFCCWEWCGGKAGLNQRVCKIIANEEFISRKFVLYGINGYLQAIQDVTSSVTVGHLSSLDVLKIPFPLPPLNEQRRIVAKLDELLSRVDACQQRLARIPVILKRFRQAVLAAACSGRLTVDWREKQGIGEGDELPEGWRWTPLEGLLPKGGIFDGPFGSNLKTSDYTESGVRVVRLENVGHLKFIAEKETFVSLQKYDALKKHTVGENDIIFASFIDEEIRACLLPTQHTQAIAKADCFCLRPDSEAVDRQYIVYQLVTRESYNSLVCEIHGATRPRINTTQLRKLQVRICTLPEQQEIVRRVEGLFKLADQLEVRYRTAQAQVDKLTQSILTKAFRGELVPQDPNDEPAEKLLERIREQRETATASQTKQKRGGKK